IIMSITISNCFQICNSPLNYSKSKYLYSFPKSQRFKEDTKPNCEKICYDLPSVIDKRKAGIGYGTKYDFTKQNKKTPAPNTYNVQSDFEIQKQHHRGFQFGVSRELMEVTGIMGNLNKKNPGPGTYPNSSTLNKVAFSFRQRTANDDPLNSKTKYVPGPGSYPIPTAISSNGRYFNSKFNSSGALNFNPARSKRFPDQNRNQAPGPGAYAPNTGISKVGNYFVSNFQSSKCRTFSHGIRNTISNENFKNTLGPGAYRLPSEFGYYQSKYKVQQDSQILKTESPSKQQ
ncbi:hypothetical protein IMG5_122550, partial [Ichthyophthirius multifiliis]